MKLVGFDVETSGEKEEYALQPHRVLSGKAWLTSAATARRDSNGDIERRSVSRPTVNTLRDMLVMGREHGITFVGWNTPFDVAWLIAMGLREEVFGVRWLDAMLLWKHLTARPDFAAPGGKRQMFGLKEAVRQYLPDEAGYEKDVDFHSDDPEMARRRLTYNEDDAEFTLRLAEKFLSEMPLKMKRNALIEARTIPHIAETLVEGLPVDLIATNTLRRKLRMARFYSFARLSVEQGVTEEVLNSPKQLSALLFQTWGLPVQSVSDKTGEPSTDKDTLDLLKDIDPRAKLVRDFREAGNLATKFCEATIKSARYNGGHRDGWRVVRPAARMYGTYTGRMTYSSKQGKGKSERPTGVALHQWKRGAEFRRIIKAPPGYVLCEFDFAGQEFRWMAVESGDTTMLELCAPGEDAHSYMGSRIARCDYRDLMRQVHAEDKEAGEKRKLGKVANLSLQYRTSANTLRIRARTDYGVKLSEIEAKAIHATYQITYRSVPEYWHRQIYKGRQQGYVETLAGRRVWLGYGDQWPRDLMWSYESTTINFPIQGVGADQKYLALCVISGYLPQVDGRFAYELHDGLFFFIPERYAQKAAREMKHILSNLPYEKAWGVKLPIQFPVDAKIGPSWGDLKEVYD